MEHRTSCIRVLHNDGYALHYFPFVLDHFLSAEKTENVCAENALPNIARVSFLILLNNVKRYYFLTKRFLLILFS